MAATEEGPEARTERMDIARGLENVPVSAWPPGAEPEPFQVGGGARPARVLLAGAPGKLARHKHCARSHLGGAGAGPGRGGAEWPREPSALLPHLVLVLWKALPPQVIPVRSRPCF